MNSMNLSYVEEQDKGIVHVKGDVDAYHTGELKKYVMDIIKNLEKSTLVLDMSEVPYIDSAGLGTLVSILREARLAKKAFVLAGLKPNVMRIFEITRLDKVFKIVDTVEEA
ncbi:MAG: STAS domain-containing protein [Thermotogae bacterium]|nr:STAS domain-containing protein [Thermotogota bacterium]